MINADILVHQENKEKLYYRIFLLVLFFLSLFVVLWSGPVSDYMGHDYLFHVRRLGVLTSALQEGMYPIYLDYENLEGYGYFTKAFYPDLILIPFALISIVGGSVFAYNVLLFVMFFLSGFFFYKLSYTLFRSSFAAAFGAILFTFSPYHLYVGYHRAALGEFISFCFLPIIFWGLYHIIKGDYKRWYILAIGYSLLIYTHVISSFLTFIFVTFLLLVYHKSLLKEPQRIKALFFSIIVTLLFVSAYIFPMLEQMMSNTYYYNIAPNITGQTKQSLNEIFWGLLSGILYKKEAHLCGIGLLLAVSVCIRLFVRGKSIYIIIADVCTLFGIGCIFFVSELFPWGRLPLGFVQFPARLYQFASFFFALGCGFYLSLIFKTKKQNLVLGTILVVLSLAVIVLSNEDYKYKQTVAGVYGFSRAEAEVPTVDNGYNLGGLEYLPDRIPSFNYIHERGRVIKRQGEQTEISDLSQRDGIVSCNISFYGQSDILELPLVYYKGYKAELNLQEIPIEQSPDGLIQVEVSESGHLEIYYAGTMVQKVSWYVTLLSIFIFCIFLYRTNRKNGSVETNI